MTEIATAVKKLLDALYELDPVTVKRWIHEKWPHGYGLYE